MLRGKTLRQATMLRLFAVERLIRAVLFEFARRVRRQSSTFQSVSSRTWGCAASMVNTWAGEATKTAIPAMIATAEITAATA